MVATSPDRDVNELAARVEELDARILALEAAALGTPRNRPTPPTEADGDTFWALRALQERVADPGAVLFTGTVRLPGGERVEWQQAAPTDDLLATDWDVAADALGALGHPVRLRLLREVLRGTRTTAELGEVEGLGTTGQLHHHLRLLVAAGWLRSASRGRYDVPVARVVPLLAVLMGGLR